MEMEKLYSNHRVIISTINTKYSRDYVNHIHWNDRLIGIKGAKGVGKSTLLLQYIKNKFHNNPEALYVSMDNISLRGITIVDIAKFHVDNGGTHLFIDEVHKYPDWSIEIKNCYDTYPDLKIVFTGSSMLHIHKSQGDLSRRAVMYTMPGLSLREFVYFNTGIALKNYSIEDIIHSHFDIETQILNEVKIYPLFQEYLKHGYYPFYMEGIRSYHQRLDQVINAILEVDLAYLHNIKTLHIHKIKKLLHLMATTVPIMPNISKLAEVLDFPRNSVTEYLYLLEDAHLLNLLQTSGRSYSVLTKPEKVYLENTNLQYSLAPENANLGTLRETFFLNQVSFNNKVNIAEDGGDFLVNEKYTFEVGGRKKSFKQIANKENSYVVIDDLMSGNLNKIPMWVFGFNY